MDYVNFRVAMPEYTYIKLENTARCMKLTVNEIILDAIMSRIFSEDGVLMAKKNAGFYNVYNKFYKG